MVGVRHVGAYRSSIRAAHPAIHSTWVGIGVITRVASGIATICGVVIRMVAIQGHKGFHAA